MSYFFCHLWLIFNHIEWDGYCLLFSANSHVVCKLSGKIQSPIAEQQQLIRFQSPEETTLEYKMNNVLWPWSNYLVILGRVIQQSADWEDLTLIHSSVGAKSTDFILLFPHHPTQSQWRDKEAFKLLLFITACRSSHLDTV
jgi:hypothetical protein